MPEAELQEFDSKDPAPLAPERDARALEVRLTDYDRPLFERFQALFTLRGMGTPDAVDVLSRALRRDPSALLRHEAVAAIGNLPSAEPEQRLARNQREDANREARDSAELALANLACLRDAESLYGSLTASRADPRPAGTAGRSTPSGPVR